MSDLQNGIPWTGDSADDFTEALRSNNARQEDLELFDDDDITTLKSDIGLENVNNTSDANKPISTATQAALTSLANDLADEVETLTEAVDVKAGQPIPLNNLVTISNSTTMTDLITFVLEGEQWVIGDALEIVMQGRLTNTTGSSQTVIPKLTFGATSDQGAVGTFPTSIVDYNWSANIRLVMTSMTTQSIWLDLVVLTASGNEVWRGPLLTSEAMTTDTSLKFSVQLGTASSSLVWTVDAAHTRRWPHAADQPFPPLWSPNYDAAGPSGTETVGPNLYWQSEQEPNSPGAGGALQTTRIQIVGAGSVPGSGVNKPVGNALRVELRPYSSSSPGSITVADGDIQGGTYNRAEVYDRHAVPGSTVASQWPDPVGSERWYGISVYLAADHATATDTTWFDFLQWKGYYGGSPPLALEIKRSNFRLGGTRANSGLIPNDGTLAPVAKGAWTQFVVGMKWSTSSSDGWVEAYVNGSLVVPRLAMATMDTSGGNPDPIYFKNGIYRAGTWAVTHILHFSAPVIARRKIDVDNKLAELLGA